MATKNEGPAHGADRGEAGSAHLGGESDTENKPDNSRAQVIGFLEKNSRERIRVAIDTFKGHIFCDLRIFASTDDGPRATKSGFTVKLEKIPELRQLLEAAEAEARKAGLL